MTQIRIFSDHS